mmetsp:Transcript_94474/g.272107  ORF Transcript_94474/g.272107 Transcript_94474/m.272107 type:complete len:440 (-) Transcript_94474:305-1624(-)
MGSGHHQSGGYRVLLGGRLARLPCVGRDLGARLPLRQEEEGDTQRQRRLLEFGAAPRAGRVAQRPAPRQLPAQLRGDPVGPELQRHVLDQVLVAAEGAARHAGRPRHATELVQAVAQGEHQRPHAVERLGHRPLPFLQHTEILDGRGLRHMDGRQEPAELRARLRLFRARHLGRPVPVPADGRRDDPLSRIAAPGLCQGQQDRGSRLVGHTVAHVLGLLLLPADLRPRVRPQHAFRRGLHSEAGRRPPARQVRAPTHGVVGERVPHARPHSRRLHLLRCALVAPGQACEPRGDDRVHHGGRHAGERLVPQRRRHRRPQAEVAGAGRRVPRHSQDAQLQRGGVRRLQEAGGHDQGAGRALRHPRGAVRRLERAEPREPRGSPALQRVARRRRLADVADLADVLTDVAPQPHEVLAAEVPDLRPHQLHAVRARGCPLLVLR